MRKLNVELIEGSIMVSASVSTDHFISNGLSMLFNVLNQELDATILKSKRKNKLNRILKK